ncbi:MAG: hypothetical protein AB7V42_12050 [Thermoleophilia bacterium]
MNLVKRAGPGTRPCPLLALTSVGVALTVGVLGASPTLAAKARPKSNPPRMLVLVKQDKPQAQPTHKVAAGTRVHLVLVGSDELASSYRVCLIGPDSRNCWTRSLGKYHDLTKVTTTLPAKPGKYRATWTAGDAHATWKLRVTRR